jgi:ABC-type lipoprotein export system ATPase subunit
MKITGIEIGEYRQFKNIKFDFTYPEDHKDESKAGKPLEKVCFIGQSGTGKTTLLNIIWNFFQVVDDGLYIKRKKFNTIGPITNYRPFKNILLSTSENGNSINFGNIDFDIEADNSKNIIIGNIIDFIDKYNLYETLDKIDKLCLFVKDSISREADAFLIDQNNQSQSFSDFIKTDSEVSEKRAERENRIEDVGIQKNVSLGDMQSLAIWQYLLKDIEDYDYTTISHVTNIIQNTPKDKVAKKLQEWVEADPRIKLGEECLNPIISKFFLEVDDSEKGKAPISLRTKQGVNISSSLLSTGTRQLLATAIPIYKFETNGTVILFDEPERSLFPDIQRELIKYYTSLAPEAQFFFATHSPIIASAFEPCERFVLYFDDNGEVKFHRGIAPEGDDPNDLLRQDFDMSELMLEKGLEAYQKYRQLGMQIRNETNERKKNELIAERLELGNRYNF